MSKKAVVQLTVTTYEADNTLIDEVIHGDEGKQEIIFNKTTKIQGTILAADPLKELSFADLTPKAFILFNKGGGELKYRISGAAADTGIIPAGGFLHIGAGLDKVEIETDATSVDWEYHIFA